MKKFLLSSTVLVAIGLTGCGTPLTAKSQIATHTTSTIGKSSITTEATQNASLKTSTSSVKKTSFLLQPGDSCCGEVSASTFQQFIMKLPGVKKVSAEHNLHMTVWYDSAQTNPNQIEREILQASGYVARG
ncbi:hypothetical protein ACOJUR_14655 [Alicyclobacillus tolerans]|uniref:hypothetical protein n=1 Tax=Alicyclobacillus tolerans TaxID=90970 RepID=UPI003B790738